MLLEAALLWTMNASFELDGVQSSKGMQYSDSQSICEAQGNNIYKSYMQISGRGHDFGHVKATITCSYKDSKHEIKWVAVCDTPTTCWWYREI